MGRLELDFFSEVDYVKETKHRALSSDAAYYHPWINCLRKRRAGLSLSPRDVKVDSSTKLDEELDEKSVQDLFSNMSSIYRVFTANFNYLVLNCRWSGDRG